MTAAPGVNVTHAQTTQSSQTAEAVRARIERLGVGQQAKTEITLRDKRKLKGYVSAAGADSFTFVDKKTGVSQTISYANVENVKKPHHGLKPSTWFVIAGVAAAAVIVGVVLKPILCDGC